MKDKIIYEIYDDCDEGITVYAPKYGKIKVAYSLEAGYCEGTSYIPVDVIIKSLQKPTEEREVEIKTRPNQIMYTGCCKICDIYRDNLYCPGCGKKIKRID